MPAFPSLKSIKIHTLTHSPMPMANSTSEEEEEAALFRSYPYALYFVQSPSTSILSHPQQPEPAPSRASNDSFTDKIKSDHDALLLLENGDQSDLSHAEETGSWVDYFSLSYSDSGWWIFLQLGWRFLLSLVLAFAVFYVAAKPPAPKVSVKIGGIRAFRLGEGVDRSGVTTKMVSCNCSVELSIDNNSNFFDLHVDPPTLRILFAHLPFATSQLGRELYVESNDIMLFRLTVGTRNKPMYGAGRSMQDLLQSGEGVPLVVRVSFSSSFNVLWGFFASRFHHEAECSVVVSDEYDKNRRTQVYSSTCFVS